MIGIAAVLSIFGLAPLAPGVHRLVPRWSGWLLALLPAALAACLIAHSWPVSRGEVSEWARPWAPALGLELAFRLDGLGLLMALLITGIGALILVYAGSYLRGDSRLGRFYPVLLLFMGAMVGITVSDNLLLLFVFWELTSLTSYLLIGFDHESAKSRKAALQALLVTGGGGLALLAAFIMLGHMGGTYRISALAERSSALAAHPWYPAMLVLLLLGCFTKSAQVPFHFWLPGAMAAPTPVSAYLHSATMVKAGVFLLARLHPALGESAAWHGALAAFGAATMFVGGVLALVQTDLKKLLAYTTVSALGTLTLLLGIGSKEALKAAAVFLVVHALYKAALFMVAGGIDHGAGTRDVRELGGLGKAMPFTALAGGLAALSMCGLPPMLGFIAKELMYEAKLSSGAFAPAIAVAGVAANVCAVGVAIMVGIAPFLGKAKGHPHEGTPGLWAGPLLLAALGTVTGLFPALIEKGLVSPAISSIRGETTVIHLHLWHGFNAVLAMSVATLVLGGVAYALREKLRAAAGRMAFLKKIGPESWYDAWLAGTLAGAARITAFVQHGSLREYIRTILVALTALAGVAIWQFGMPSVPWAEGFNLSLGGVGLVIAAATLVVVRARARFVVLAAMSVVGYGVAACFALYGAPDLAITQLLAETLTLLLFVLVLYHLPVVAAFSTKGQRVRDAVLAVAAGAMMSLLVLKAIQVDAGPAAGSWFAENSLKAYGRNVVNVILVDFRALDTLGEITVLGIAALGVGALMWKRRNGKEDSWKA